MTEDDTLRLRAAGFTDVEIVNIAMAAAARNFYSRAIQALGADVDVPTALSAELRDALVATA
jgi:alkylhydroperoxidase family enzyme